MEETLTYQEIAEVARDIILVMNLEGRIIKANEAACEAYGYSREQLLKMSIFNLRAPETASLVYSQMGQASKDGIVFETRHVRKDGSVFPVEVSSRRAVIGNRILLFSTIRDISDRVNRDTELLKLFTAVEQSPVSVVITDLQGNIEYVNPKFTQVTGYTAAEAKGQNPRILKSGEQPPEVYQQLWKTIEAGGEWRGEFHNKKKNGELYWELASISPIRNAAGKSTHYIAIKEDITARKEAEAALWHANAELNQIIESSGDGLCVVDLDTRILRANSAFAAMCGREKEELIGLKSCDVFPCGFCETVICSFGRALKGESRFEFDQEVAGPDGQKKHWVVTINPFYDATGTLSAMVKTYKDITERVRIQETLRHDLQLAGKIQRGFLPKPFLTEFMEINTVFEPYQHVSGDVFDYVWDEQRKIMSGYIIDVMGHGIGTALQTAALRVLCRQAMEKNLSPRAKLTWINREAMPYFAEDSFAAAIYFEFDLEKNVLKYSAAGINYFLAVDGKKQQVVSIPGPYLGITTEIEFEEHELAFTPGNCFYFMSDGLFDLMGAEDTVDSMTYRAAVNFLRLLTKSSKRRDDASALCIHVK